MLTLMAVFSLSKSFPCKNRKKWRNYTWITQNSRQPFGRSFVCFVLFFFNSLFILIWAGILEVKDHYHYPVNTFGRVLIAVVYCWGSFLEFYYFLFLFAVYNYLLDITTWNKSIRRGFIKVKITDYAGNTVESQVNRYVMICLWIFCYLFSKLISWVS